MAFEYQPTTYKLNFEDGDLKGLLVRIQACTLGEFNEMQKMAQSKDTGALEGNNHAEEMFIRYLVEWDLAKDGKVLPMEVSSLEMFEPGLFVRLLQAWQLAMMSVPTTSSAPSNNGETSPEQSLGLESESVSPGSWPNQN
jgi:hypothetical protein